MDSAVLPDENSNSSPLVQEIAATARECLTALQSGGPLDSVLPKLEGILLTLEEVDVSFTWKNDAIALLHRIIQLLSIENDYPESQGTTKIILPVENIELLLSLRFKIVDIARFYNVSRYTVARRLQEHGITVSKTLKYLL